MAVNLNYKNEKNILRLMENGVPYLEYPMLWEFRAVLM